MECIICNYCGLNGQMSACIVLQQAMVLIDKGYINYQLNYNTPQASDSLQISPDGNRKVLKMSDFAPGHLRHIHKSHLLAMGISNPTRCDMNSGFWHKEDENSTLLGYYAVSSGNSSVTFWENLLVSSSGDLWRWDRYVVPKCQEGITTTRCVITHYNAVLLYDFVCYPTASHQTNVTNIYIIYACLFPSNYVC